MAITGELVRSSPWWTAALVQLAVPAVCEAGIIPVMSDIPDPDVEDPDMDMPDIDPDELLVLTAAAG